MKATINLEFTDQELTGFVERWANKVLAGALSDLAGQVGPLVPAIRDVVMRAVAGQVDGFRAQASAEASPERPNDALAIYDSILSAYPAERVTIVVVDGSTKGRCVIRSKPRNAVELLAAIKAVHDDEVRPQGATYAVWFFDENDRPLGTGWVTIAPDPPPSSAGG